MVKIIFTALLFTLSVGAIAQQTREELDKQKADLKRQYEQTEKLLNENKTKSKENLVQWKYINDKVNIQERIIDNINRDINYLDNNLITTQKDINRYDKLLDTLKQEYAKSMVYAYKNRSNYDFLNFIFSASSFNDAIKRITYLKSYRNYREMQGENILRTQDLRKKRIEELKGTKEKKNTVLQDKDKEMSVLEVQQKEKDRMLNELKKQGKQLNTQLAATKNQMKKVDNAINAAIKRAMDDARRLAARNAANEKIKTDAATAAAKANAKNNTPATTTTTSANPVKKVPTIVAPTKKEVDVSPLLNSENVALNTNFVNNRGALPWPVDNGVPIMHFGSNKLPSGAVFVTTAVTVASAIGTPVKAVFDGTVLSVTNVEDMQVVILQHGKYFSTYSNLLNVSVQRGQTVQRGQVLGKVGANLEGQGEVSFYISDENKNLDPERWLRHR